MYSSLHFMLLCTITHCLSLKSNTVVLLKLAVSLLFLSWSGFLGFFLVIVCSVSPDSETMSLSAYFLFAALSILNSVFSLPFLLCSSSLGVSPDPLCTLPPPPPLTTLSSCACLLTSASIPPQPPSVSRHISLSYLQISWINIDTCIHVLLHFFL